MAVQALVNQYLSINASDVSAFVKSATLVVDVNELDATAMGDGWSDVVGGLKAGTLNVELFDDYAASQIDAVLWPLLGTKVAFETRPDTAAVGTSNPKYTGTVLISHHSFGAAVGELPMKSFAYKTSGAVTRATA